MSSVSEKPTKVKTKAKTKVKEYMIDPIKMRKYRREFLKGLKSIETCDTRSKNLEFNHVKGMIQNAYNLFKLALSSLLVKLNGKTGPISKEVKEKHQLACNLLLNIGNKDLNEKKSMQQLKSDIEKVIEAMKDVYGKIGVSNFKHDIMNDKSIKKQLEKIENIFEGYIEDIETEEEADKILMESVVNNISEIGKSSTFDKLEEYFSNVVNQLDRLEINGKKVCSNFEKNFILSLHEKNLNFGKFMRKLDNYWKSNKAYKNLDSDTKKIFDDKIKDPLMKALKQKKNLFNS